MKNFILFLGFFSASIWLYTVFIYKIKEDKKLISYIFNIAKDNNGIVDLKLLGNRVCLVPSWTLYNMSEHFFSEHFPGLSVPNWINNLNEGAGWLLVIEDRDKLRIALISRNTLEWEEPDETSKMSIICPQHLSLSGNKIVIYD